MAAQVGLRSFLAATSRSVAPPPLLWATLRPSTLPCSRIFSSRTCKDSLGLAGTRSLCAAAPVRASASSGPATWRIPTPLRSSSSRRPVISILNLLAAQHQSSPLLPRRCKFTTSSRRNNPSSSSFLSTILPRPSSRLDEYVFWAIVALNGLVFLTWKYAGEVWRLRGDWKPYRWMTQHFMNSEVNLKEGRWWSLIGACFSHEAPSHFLINMMSLVFMGLPVVNIIGAASFVSLYVGAGVAANVGSLLWYRYGDPWVMRNGGQAHRQAATSVRSGYSYGASGAVYAIVTSFACMAPKATFLLAFIIPVPAWMCVSGLFAFDMWKVWTTPGSKEDAAGHVSGILAGLLFWRLRLRGRVMV